MGTTYSRPDTAPATPSGSASGSAVLEGITITARIPGDWTNDLAVALERSAHGTGDPSTSPPSSAALDPIRSGDTSPPSAMRVDFVVTRGLPTSGQPAPELERLPGLPADDPVLLAQLISAGSEFVTARASHTWTGAVFPAAGRFLAGGGQGKQLVA